MQKPNGVVRIGVGSSFADDRIGPAVELAERGQLDYLAFECLAERTIARENLTRQKDPEKGYTPRLLERMAEVTKPCLDRGVRIITNMGAANPLGAARAVRRQAKEQGLGDIACAVVLLLDTSEPGTHEGAYCLKRQAWLTRALEAAGEAPVLVCMHHPPMALGTWSDRSRQRDHEALGAILAGSGKVRHMLMGHTHRACSGTWHGIGYTVLHGIGPQNVLRWGSDERPDFQDGPAHVAIVDFAGGDVRVHVTDVTGHHRVWPRPPA